MTMRKFKMFWAWQYKAEEKWLAEMEAQGWHFKKYRFFYYVFEKGEPNQYQYRLEMLPEMPAHQKSKEYIRFMEDMGIEVVDSYLRWVYFRKPYSDEPFEVYSDLDHRIKHLKGLLNFLRPMLVLLICNVINCINLTRNVFPFGFLLQILNIFLMLSMIAGLSGIKKQLAALEKERAIRE